MVDFDPFGEEDVIEESKPQEEQSATPEPVNLEPVDVPEFDPFDEIEQEQRRAVLALEGDSQRAAESRELSARFQVSRTAADIKHDDFKKQAEKDDAQTMLGDTPFLASWLAQNPLDAPIFKDDLGALKEVEEGFRKVGHLIEVDPYQKTKWDETHGDYLGIYETEGMEDPENSTGNAELDHDIFMRRRPEIVAPVFRSAKAGIEAGYLQGEKGALYHRAMMGEVDMDESFKRKSQELDEAIQKATGTYGDDFAYSAAQILGTMGSAFKHSGQGATVGAAFGTLGAMATASASTGPFAGLTFAGLASLSMATGLADSTLKIEGGLAYADMLKEHTDPVKARRIAMGVGAVNSIVEMLGLHYLGEAAKPILKAGLARRVAKTAEALEDPSFMRALGQVGKAYSVGVGQEVVTEVIQEGVNITGEEIARMWADGQQDPATVDAVVDRLVDIAVQTTKGAAVLGLAGLGAGATIQAKRIMHAQDTQLFFEKLNDAIPKMNAKNLSPDAVHEYIAAQASESGNTTTYIDAGEFHQAMIDTGVTVDELRQVLPEVADKLEQASLNGADIEISTADYATKLAGTKLGGQLTQSVRLSPDALSARDAIKVQQAFEAMRKELVKGTFDSKAAGDRFVANITSKKYREKQTELERRYVEDLKALTVEKGNFNEQEAHIQARLASGMIVNLAQRANIPVERIDAIAPRLVAGGQSNGSDLHQIVGVKGAANIGYSANASLTSAEAMETKGYSPEKIKLATGWERGVDGKWRYEIPDMQLKENAFSDLEALDAEKKERLDTILETAETDDEYFTAVSEEENKRRDAVVSRKLGNLVDAPELFEAYPGLADITVEFGPLENDVRGYYDPSSKVIRLPNEVPLSAFKKEPLKILVHEVQHAIQYIEGFATGANPMMFPSMGEALAADMKNLFKMKKSDVYAKYRKALQAVVENNEYVNKKQLFTELDAVSNHPEVISIQKEEQRLRDKWGYDSDVAEAISNATSEFDEIFQKISQSNRGYQTSQYLRVAGEVEARNASNRIDLTEEERRRKPIESTEGVPRSEQIIRNEDGAFSYDTASEGSALNPLEQYIEQNPEKKDAVENLKKVVKLQHQREVALANRARSQRKYQREQQRQVKAAAKEAGINIEDANDPITRQFIIDIIVDEAETSLADTPSALGWYNEKVRKCLAVAGLIFPELNRNSPQFDVNAEFAFIYATAITSNGLKVSKNLPIAVESYEEYRKTGKFKLVGTGAAMQAINQSLEMFHELLKNFENIDEMRKFFMTNWSVKQLGLMGFQIGGEASTEMVRGAAILGPKIGNGFFSNLYGLYSALTMDRWFMRTIGRWTGTLFTDTSSNVNEGLTKLRKYIQDLKKNPADLEKANEYFSVDFNGELTDEKLIEITEKWATKWVPSEVRLEHQKIFGDAKAKAQRTAMNAVGKNVTDGKKEVEQLSPRGSGQRSTIRSIFDEALSIIRTKDNMRALSMADLQALLWYAEKRLYESSHVRAQKKTEEEGASKKPDEKQEKLDYDEGEAPDYANVMVAIAKERHIDESKIKEALESVDSEIAKEEKSGQAARQRYETLDDDQRRHVLERSVLGNNRRSMGAHSGEKQSESYNRVYKRKESKTLGSSGRRDGEPSGNDRGNGKEALEGVQLGSFGESKLVTLAKWAPGSVLKSGLAEIFSVKNATYKSSSITFEEVVSNDAGVSKFADAANKAKSERLYGALIDVPSSDELKGCRLFVSSDGKSGFALKDTDEIVSVYHDLSGGAGSATLQCALAAGGRRIRCFDAVQANVYGMHGFVLVAKLKFDPARAPANWDSDLFSAINNGYPDEQFMVFDPNSPIINDIDINQVGYVSSYKEAVEKQRERLEQSKESIEHFRSVVMGASNSTDATFFQSAKSQTFKPDTELIDRAIKLRGQGVKGAFAQTDRGSFNAKQNAIKLTPNADLSTFAHEMSHWYLDMLFKLAGEEGVSETILEDVNTLLNEFGVESLEAWRAMSVDDQRKHHETFAAWTETYLAEGKAPTPRLERLLARFADWLKAVYKQFRDPREEIAANYKRQFGTELPPISDEVRRVLDRMIASDEALEQAQSAHSLKPLFDQKPDDMSDEDWKEMMLARDEAEQRGAEAIAQARAKDERWYHRARSKKLAEIQKKGEELKNSLREKISRKINGLPGVVALDLLKQGGSLGVETMKLDPDALWVLGFSEKKIATLRSLGVLKKGTLGRQIAKMRKQGMSDVKIREALKIQAEQQISASRELLRPFARFNSNEKMIEAIVTAGDRDQMIEDEVTRQAMAQHSEWFDEKKREAIVTKALHNEARARLVATELKYLMNDREGNSRIYREAARMVAAEMLAKMPMKSVRWKNFVAAESRASRKAYECVKKGDRMGAVLAKRQQLVQHEAVAIAMGIEKKAATLKATKKLVFGSDKKVAKSMDIDIIGVVRYILTNSGYGRVPPSENDPTVADKHIKHLGSLDDARKAFFQSYIDKYKYRGGKVAAGDLTVEAFETLADDVAQLVGLAKDAKKMLVKGKKENLENVVNELLEQTGKVDRKRFTPGKESQVRPNEKATFSVLWWETQLLRVETWCRMMDGGQEGPFTKYIYRPVAEAAAKYRVENSKLQKKLVELIRERQEAWAKQGSIDAHEIGYEFKTKQELIGALLHTGNQSNLEKLLLGGRGEGKRWAELVELPNGAKVMLTDRWDAFIARCYQEGIITKEDMDFCQAVWDLLESTKPAAQKAFKDLYGYNFVEVEATQITTPFGVYRGGYVPAITSKFLVAEASTHQEIERITSNDYMTMMPVTTPGFAKTRARGYTEPLLFDVSLLCGHVSKVLKFSYIAPAVYEVGKVITDRQFARALFELNPHFVDAMLKPWLKRAYTQSVSTGESTWIDQKLNKLRSIAGMNIMAGHLLNALQQWTGLSVAMAKVSPKSLAKAAALLSSGNVTVKDIIAKSSTIGSRLADRAIEYESEIARIASGENRRIDKAEGKYDKMAAIYEKGQPARDWISQHGYFFQTLMQAPIDCIVWLAAYNEACARGLSDVDAVAEADSVVRTTQSDFSPENIAGIEAGSALYRAFLVFYNYFGMQANLLAESWVTKDYGVFARDAMMIVYIPSIISAIIANMGFDFDDDEDVDAYDVLHLLIAEPFKNVMAIIPFLGSAAATGLQNAAASNVAVIGDIGRFLYGEDPYAGRLFSSPAIDLLASSAKGVGDLTDIIAGEEVDARRATRNILDLVTLVTGIPMGAIKRPAGYLAGVAAGDYSAENPAEIAKGLVTGKGDE